MKNYLVTILLFSLWLTPVYAQEQVGPQEDIDLEAYRLFSRGFSVLGERRIVTTFSYLTDEQSILILNASQQEVTLTTTLTANIGKRAEISVSIPLNYRHIETSIPEADRGSSVSEDDNGIGGIAIDTRYVLNIEQAVLPELTLLGNVTIPTGVGELDGEDIRAAIGISAVKTAYPAFLFGSITIANSFDNGVDIDPVVSYFFGIAVAMNDQLNLRLSFDGSMLEEKQNGLLGESSILSIGVTYSVSHHWFIESLIGVGLTEQSSDRIYSISVGRRF